MDADEKPLKSLTMAITNIARPYITDAMKTKIFRRPVRSDSLPLISEAATMTADWASCRGRSVRPSASVLPILSSRK